MLRINLLPPYIYEGAKRRNVVILWVVVLAAVVGAFIFWKMKLTQQADDIAKATNDLEPTAAKADKLQADATATNARNAVTKAKWTFVDTAKVHNSKDYIEVFDHVRDFTISKVLYSGVTPANDEVRINAYAPTLADVGHYMLAMEKNPNIRNVSVAMSSIPSFPVQPGAQQAQGGNLGMPQGFGGSGGGGSGAPGGGAPIAQEGMSAGGFGGSGGRPSIPQGGGPPAAFGGRGGGGSASGGGNQQQAAGVRPPGGGGHDFAVTLQLNKPIAPAPTYPAGGGSGGGQGGGGPMGGGPGMGGGSGGMGSGAMGSGAMMGGAAGRGTGGKVGAN